MGDQWESWMELQHILLIERAVNRGLLSAVPATGLIATDDQELGVVPIEAGSAWGIAI